MANLDKKRWLIWKNNSKAKDMRLEAYSVCAENPFWAWPSATNGKENKPMHSSIIMTVSIQTALFI